MSGSPFETITPYQDIPAGAYTLDVNIAGATNPVFTQAETLVNVSAYTFAAFGATSTVNGFLLNDTLFINVPTNNFALRLANASTTAGGIDIYLTRARCGHQYGGTVYCGYFLCNQQHLHQRPARELSAAPDARGNEASHFRRPHAQRR